MIKDFEVFEKLKYEMLLYDILSEKVCDEYAITKTELDVLAFLNNHPGKDTASDIVTLRRLPKANVSQAVDTLIQKSYLDRKTDERDRRKIHLSITVNAQRLTKAIEKMQKSWQDIRFDGFTKEEKERYQVMLYRIYENSKREIEKINMKGGGN